jgi:hypothetical protein
MMCKKVTTNPLIFEGNHKAVLCVIAGENMHSEEQLILVTIVQAKLSYSEGKIINVGDRDILFLILMS